MNSWKDGYSAFLTERQKVAENKISFYVFWVGKYLAFSCQTNNAPEQEPGNKIDRFLAELGKTYEDWQVKQAHDAVKLFQYFQAQGNRSKKVMRSGVAASRTSPAWQQIEEQFIKALRLRHRSLSTEKTYISWLRHFRHFLQSLP